MNCRLEVLVANIHARISRFEIAYRVILKPGFAL